MEFLTLLAIVFLIKSTIGILDTIITSLNDMNESPEILFESNQVNLEVERTSKIESLFETIRYIIIRQCDTTVFLICATYLYFIL